MSDESTPEPKPTPEEPSADYAPQDAPEGASALPKAFLAHFPRSPIPRSDYTIRSPSMGQVSATYEDMANEELDDREFTVCLVQRQLDQDVSIEDVRSWTDEQLLAAAGAYLSLDRGEDDEEDEEGADEKPVEGDGALPEPDADSGEPGKGATVEEAEPEVDAEPDPLTFAAVRETIREQSVRRAQKLKRMFAGISSLTSGPLSPSITAATKGIDMAAYKSAIAPLAGMDLSKITGALSSSALHGIDLKGLAGTSAMGDALKEMMADTQAVQKFTLPALEMRTWEPEVYRPLHIEPLVRPEIGLLRDVNESLEKMHDDQVRFDEHQIEVLTQQGQLIKKQGEALEALVSDAKGQKWNRLITIVATVVMTIATVVAVLYAAGLLHSSGTAAPAASAPIVTSGPAAPSPSLVTTP